MLLCARAQTRNNDAGYANAAQNLRKCDAIIFGAKFTLFENKVKLFTAAVPREADGIRNPGAGLHVAVQSGSTGTSFSELQAVLQYTGPSSHTYVIAFVRLLQLVPSKVCVVRGTCGFAVGDQVRLLADQNLSMSSVRAKKLGSTEKSIKIKSRLLAPVTSYGKHGDHHALKYAGPYLQYSYDPSQDCSAERYETVDEIHAIDPATAVSTRVMLVPDRDGTDTLGRRRYWWYCKLFHH